jgi:hypothetical protein
MFVRRRVAQAAAFSRLAAPLLKSPGRQVDGGSLAEILFGRRATRQQGLNGFRQAASSPCNACKRSNS